MLTHPAAYEIRSCDNLICLTASGCLTLDEVWRLNKAFWQVWGPEYDRALFDYRQVTQIDLSVAEFTAAGISEQARVGPPSQRMRAAYIATNPVVFGFARVIQGVWMAYADVSIFEALPETLAWLEVSEQSFAAARELDRG